MDFRCKEPRLRWWTSTFAVSASPASKQQLSVLRGHRGNVSSLSAHRGSRLIVSTGADTAMMWDLSRAHRLRQLTVKEEVCLLLYFFFVLWYAACLPSVDGSRWKFYVQASEDLTADPTCWFLFSHLWVRDKSRSAPGFLTRNMCVCLFAWRMERIIESRWMR